MTDQSVSSVYQSSRMGRRSLRFQLVLILLALLLVSFVLVAAVTAVFLHRFLLDRLDQQLVAAGDRFAIALEHPSDHDTDDSAPFNAVTGQAAGTLGARIVAGRVTSAAVVGRSDSAAVTGADRALIGRLSAGADPRTVGFPDLGEYRVVVSRGADGDLLVTGLPEAPVDETVSHLLAVEAMVGGVALIIAGLAAAVSVRWSLRPLRRVASTARQVSELPLSTGLVQLPGDVPAPSGGTEVGQVADAFNRMLRHVGSALRQRHDSEDQLRRFTADASHELRTPITVIRSHAEYAQHAAGPLPPIASEALTRITAEAERMGRLVEDMSLLARLDAGRALARDPVELTRLVVEAVSDARVAGPTHRWLLDLPAEPVTVIGDTHALHQVLANLLSNARDHTPAGTIVTTSVRPPPEGDATCVSVHDNGPGIPSAEMPTIFDRFVRSEASRSRIEGSGLGLSIAAAIVNAHAGTIRVTSQPGDTTFIVSLPLVATTDGIEEGAGSPIPVGDDPQS
jgi:two-component system, OmpR family, sensor kinase